MNFIWCKFKDLNVDQLYEILRQRQAIFIIEQNCIFPDIDLLDQDCHHLSLWDGKKLCGYLRVHPPGVKYPEVCIGRVITPFEARGKGYGKLVMAEALKNIEQTYGSGKVRISAQSYLEKFYGDFGFKKVGESYLEDGILHTEMVRD